MSNSPRTSPFTASKTLGKPSGLSLATGANQRLWDLGRRPGFCYTADELSKVIWGSNFLNIITPSLAAWTTAEQAQPSKTLRKMMLGAVALAQDGRT